MHFVAKASVVPASEPIAPRNFATCCVPTPSTSACARSAPASPQMRTTRARFPAPVLCATMDGSPVLPPGRSFPTHCPCCASSSTPSPSRLLEQAWPGSFWTRASTGCRAATLRAHARRARRTNPMTRGRGENFSRRVPGWSRSPPRKPRCRSTRTPPLLGAARTREARKELAKARASLGRERREAPLSGRHLPGLGRLLACEPARRRDSGHGLTRHVLGDGAGVRSATARTSQSAPAFSPAGIPAARGSGRSVPEYRLHLEELLESEGTPLASVAGLLVAAERRSEIRPSAV